MLESVYRDQVSLLIRVLPLIAEETVFALKGGTAINLFMGDFPRLSIDIDLVYLPLNDRNVALKEISATLKAVRERIEKTIPKSRVNSVPTSAGDEVKLNCKCQGAQIKIEVNTTMRGNLFETSVISLSDKVQEEFEAFLEMKVISDGELYGGKICAALDRQHPRDLFDIYYSLNSEGITSEIKMGFIYGLLSHKRPINEIINPRLVDQKNAFERQFSGMVFRPFTYADFENTRVKLIHEVNASLSTKDRSFLISFKEGDPDWSLFDSPKLKEMPSVQWKLMNIKSLKKLNPEKHERSLNSLKERLNSR